MEDCKVIFYPEGRTVTIQKGMTLLEAASRAGIYINSICGGDGVCGKCKLIVREGSVSAEPTNLLTREEIQRSIVIACQTRVNSDVEVELPLETRLEEAQILTESHRKKKFIGLFSPVEEVEGLEKLEKGISFSHSPLSTKIFLEIPPPTLNDSISDLQRIYREIRKHKKLDALHTGLPNIKKLGSLLRRAGWKVTVTLGTRDQITEILQFEEGDTSRSNYGIAIDVGTTTVVAALLDLNTGKLMGTKANYNTQISYGEDVISRIIYASDEDGLHRLNYTVVENINALISSLALEHNIRLSDITAILCAGNTTMIHLLMGINPASIRQEPYIPTANFFPVIRAAELGIKINPRGLLATIPGVSSYVGGDISAGVLASGMTDSDDISILMDIGTNGEVVLGNRDWLICCSCSAGPAFEGGGIKCGMRASKGAIQTLRIDLVNNTVDFDTISGAKPRGICGSALIDAVAEMMRWKIIDRAGKFRHELPSERIRKTEEGWEFILVESAKTATGSDIVINELDLENLIRAKGAMFVGTEFLLKKVNIDFDSVKNFYIGGGFGNYLNIENAVTIGLLPDIPLERFQFIGNSSLTGAKLALLSTSAYRRSKEIAEKMTNFELSVEPSFMNEYTSALFLPHTDLYKFPNVARKLSWVKENKCPLS